ncbi:MAG: Esterase [Candidatus Woesebacteria bacterium GW2011_GWA1_37_8]|uniref:Esterase n=1 Tax=Candidatus Woesebacteria bacterium GW2011_GWA1_37_8 TaxID=1618546 RepID=A0A0G0HQ37_9BACT|nr:MAG: Esterase [Candidatus Woesebacteria bacterium GW2011_GWA1_37_8]
MNFIILHGLGKKPTEEWYTNLSTELKDKGHNVFVPQLPCCFKPNLDKTYKFLTSKYKLNENTVLIGHSSGASFEKVELEKNQGLSKNVCNNLLSH